MATAGATVTKSHTTVATARIKKSGHMNVATRKDTMGGKLYNKGWYERRDK